MRGWDWMVHPCSVFGTCYPPLASGCNFLSPSLGYDVKDYGSFEDPFRSVRGEVTRPRRRKFERQRFCFGNRRSGTSRNCNEVFSTFSCQANHPRRLSYEVIPQQRLESTARIRTPYMNLQECQMGRSGFNLTRDAHLALPPWTGVRMPRGVGKGGIMLTRIILYWTVRGLSCAGRSSPQAVSLLECI